MLAEPIGSDDSASASSCIDVSVSQENHPETAANRFRILTYQMCVLANR